ncbi:MAG TPA: nicotinate phosphoribosyltransferase [Patescibacteria group bacterium]
MERLRSLIKDMVRHDTTTRRGVRNEGPTIPLTDTLKKELEKPTISSFLDLDFYKLTMGQFIWENKELRDVPVTYEFKNRAKDVPLAKYIPQDVLEAQLTRIQNIRITNEDIAYLKSIKGVNQNLFSDAYLNSLKSLNLPPVEVSQKDGQYNISVKGPWSQAIYWETLILSTVNELYYRALGQKSGRTFEKSTNEGRLRLQSKIKRLKGFITEENAQGRKGPILIDFGTRRRFDGDWQEEVVKEMTYAFPNNFLGTSNVELSRKLHIPAIGTTAHEMDMVFSGLYHKEDDKERTFASHNKLLDMWYNFREYGKKLSIALTDTYGSDFFFDNFTQDQALKWNGIRQDSGDPSEFAEKAIKFYKEKGIDPTTKTLIFSDGLDIDSIMNLYKKFYGKINVVFAWGTTLTNDVGYRPLSLVIKATHANGYELAKLSDTTGKETGTRESIKRAKRLSQYHGGINRKIVV